MIANEHLQQLQGLRQKRSDLRAAWLRQLLTIASGGLALMAGLGPRIPDSMHSIGKYLLAGTWVFLGLGILSGALATYSEVHSAGIAAEAFLKRLQQSLEQRLPLSSVELVIGKPNRIFGYSQRVMIASLVLAVCCLVGYSTILTLSS